jgi:hypothetical protein
LLLSEDQKSEIRISKPLPSSRLAGRKEAFRASYL